MSNYIDENLASKAADKGTFIGECSPSRETKGSFWQVYLYNGELIAVAISDVMSGWVVCGEKITRDTIAQYVDDPAAALAKLDSISA